MRRVVVALAAVLAALAAPAAPAHAATGQQPVRLGFCGGDDWEPDMATHGRWVYVVYTHYPGDPGCDAASGEGVDWAGGPSAPGHAEFASAC